MANADLKNKSYEKLSIDYQNAKHNSNMSAFVIKMSKHKDFADWLNSDTIGCDDFFQCTLSTPDIESKIELIDSRKKTLKWMREIEKLIQSSVPLENSFTSIVNGISNMSFPSEEKVQNFIFLHTRIPNFYNDAHEVLFFYFFANISKNRKDIKVLTDHLLEDPLWVTDSMILSRFAVLIDHILIKIVLDVIANADKKIVSKMIIEDLYDSIKGLTGLECKSEDQECLKSVYEWYDKNNNKLTLNYTSLYPSPGFEPLFIIIK